MRKVERIDRILKLLKILWMRYPDWRLSQLIVNSIRMGKPGLIVPDIFYYEDDDLENGIKKLIGE